VTSSADRGAARLDKLAFEAAAAGLAYGAGLCAASAFLVASFQPGWLSYPYWDALPWLRTDTCGVLAFFVASISFATSEYLRARRGTRPTARDNDLRRSLALAISKTGIVFATVLFVYLSTNAVTHPWTLSLPATHLGGWPTEGALRALSVLVCAGSAAALRYLTGSRCGPPDGEPEKA
jgi:hypothetical protein